MKMLRCWINDKLQNSRFPFVLKLFSLSADWWRKILMQSKRASCFDFKPGFRMTSAKICLPSEKILLFLQSR